MQAQIITIYGKNYKQVPELEPRSCNGCSFHNSDDGCKAPREYNRACFDSGLIYATADTVNPEVSAEQKFTVDEFVAMTSSLQCYLPESVVEQLKAMTDPEYQQYLELKKKFD